MFDALKIAKYIVNKCVEDGCPISNLQLQKILYYIQRLFLRHGEPAFYAKIEAWQFGPVVPSVYYYFCGFGALPITMRYDILLDGVTPELDALIEEKRQLDPWDLVAETHNEDGAWYKIYNSDASNVKGKEIPRDLIRQLV